MLEEVAASRFYKRMTNGRTSPLLIGAEYSDGRMVDVVAKFSKGADIGPAGLTREALCAMLAADLGLPVPPPFLVRVDQQFIASVSDIAPDEATLLRSSIPVGFGSGKLPSGYSSWMRDRPVPAALRQAASEILAFDLLIQNPDRRPENPNLLWRGDQFAIFDHELALMTEGVLFWRPPWEPGALTAAAAANKHVLTTGLRGNVPDLSRLTAAWAGISDARLKEYREALPVEWSAASGVANAGITFLRQLRDNVQLAMSEVIKVLP